MNLTFTLKTIFGTVLLLFFANLGLHAQNVPCAGGDANGHACNDVDMLAFIPLSEMNCPGVNDIWGWTDPMTGKEYVILGCTNGTTFFDVSDPINPVFLGDLPTYTNNSTWRDMKVYADHAFIVSEAAGHGIQVFDLSRLRDVAAPPITFTEDAHLDSLGNGLVLGNSHNIVINEGSGYAYTVGNGGLCSGGLAAVDISSPLNPTFAGCFSAAGYTHDAQCVNYIGPDPDYAGSEICFNSNGNTGFVIAEVSDKTDMEQISSASYANQNYTHQGWATEDHQYFLMNDELDESGFGQNTRTHLWDIRDLDLPIYMGYFESTEAAIDHNLYIKGNYAYMSNYTAGLRIIDISDIANGNLTEAAYFDVYTPNNSANFSGSWSNYPYFPSGTIAVTSRGEGLFLLQWSPTFLSVELSDFAANPTTQAIELSWTTASEQNHDSFIVERSTDANSFERIGSLPATGNATTSTSYEYLDQQVLPGITYYYRLKQIATDGEIEFSETVSAKIELSDTFTGIYPNPVGKSAQLIVSSKQEGLAYIHITDANGRLVERLSESLSVGTNVLELNTEKLARGVYFIQIENKPALRFVKM